MCMHMVTWETPNPSRHRSPLSSSLPLRHLLSGPLATHAVRGEGGDGASRLNLGDTTSLDPQSEF